MDSKISEEENQETSPLIGKCTKGETTALNVKHRRLCFLIVGFILLLHMFAYTLNSYVMNEYAYVAIKEKTYPDGTDQTGEDITPCTGGNSSEGYKQQQIIQKLQTQWTIYCTLASNIPSIFINIYLVTNTDVYGRQLFFLAPLTGTLLKSLLCSIGIYFKFRIEWFVAFYFVEGCGGLWIASLAMTFCLLADLTLPGKNRSFAIGVVEVSFELGSLLSSVLSGYLIKYTNGFLIPAVLSEVVTFLSILVVIFLLPETLPDSKRRQQTSFLQNTKNVTAFYTSNIVSFSNKWLFIIALVIFILSYFSIGNSNVNILYELGRPFCWSLVKIGNFGTIQIIIGCVASVTMIKLFHLFTTDEMIALVACITSTASNILQGIATTNMMLYLVPVIGVGKSLAMPMMRGIMSKMSPAHLQGSLFGGLAAVEAIINMTGSVTANAIYGATVDFYQGTVFFVSAGYNVISCLLCLLLITKMRSYAKDSTPA